MTNYSKFFYFFVKLKIGNYRFSLLNINDLLIDIRIAQPSYELRVE